jgi:hypothetical protein
MAGLPPPAPALRAGSAEDGVLVIRRIHVDLRSPRRKTRATVERVHGMYAMRCPLYRTLHTAIALSSSCTLT